MAKLGFVLCAAFVLLLLPACGSEESTYEGPRVPVRVMTRNLYLGADISGVLLAKSVQEVPQLAGAFWAEVLRSDFPARAKLLADEIVATKPDLIGLQEVELFRRQAPSDHAAAPGLNATEVVFDFLALLQAELVARGEPYVVAANNTLSDVELPATLPEGLVDLRMTDRDVILVRPGIVFTEPVNATFANFLSGDLGGVGGPRIEIKRGHSRINVQVSHPTGVASFVFGNSHLEVGGPLRAYQEPQADELVRVLRPVSGPLVFAGDFNSPADGTGTRSYGFLRNIFDDPYADLKPGDPGYTCCIDIYVGDPSAAGSRIDLVLTRGDVAPLDAAIVGVPAKTPMGLSASDHLGVVMTLGLVPDAAR